MTHAYIAVLALHVVVAILGIGPIAAIVVVAAIAPRSGQTDAGIETSLGTLLRFSTASLVLMLVTGVLLGIIATTNGSNIHEAWWFRASALLLIPIGALLARARRSLRRVAELGPTIAFARVQQSALAICIIVAVVAVLMETKLF